MGWSPPVVPPNSTSPASWGGAEKSAPYWVLGSVSWVDHSSLPVFWSRAMKRPSRLPMKTLPRPTVTPRLAEA